MAWLCMVHASFTVFSHVVFILTHIKSLELMDFKKSNMPIGSANLKDPIGYGVCRVKQFLKCLQTILVGSTPWVVLARGQPAGQGKWLFPSVSLLWCWGWSTVCNSGLLNRRQTRVTWTEWSSRGWRASFA